MSVTFAMFASECQPKNITGSAGYSAEIKDKANTFCYQSQRKTFIQKTCFQQFHSHIFGSANKITIVKDTLSSDGNKEPPIKQIVLHFLIIYQRIYLKLLMVTYPTGQLGGTLFCQANMIYFSFTPTSTYLQFHIYITYILS